jgi:hypothetical protein
LFAIEIDQTTVSKGLFLKVAVALVIVVLGISSYLSYTYFQSPTFESTVSEDSSLSASTKPDLTDSLVKEIPTAQSDPSTIEQKEESPRQKEPLDPKSTSLTTNTPVQMTSSSPFETYKRKYASVMNASTWYELQRALVKNRDSGSINFYPSRDSLQNKEGAMVVIIDPNAASNSAVDAFLLFTDSRFINLKTNEEISSLSQRYPGKREIWVRYQQ